MIINGNISLKPNGIANGIIGFIKMQVNFL